MKCTRCHTSCSDLRDICPECYLDFRPLKREAGLPITNPDLSYDQLLARVGVDISSLFDAEFDEISMSSDTIELSMGGSSLGAIINPQEADLLFDLSYEVLENPEAEKKYVEPAFTEESRTIDAATLQKELESIRERITSPLLGLKKPLQTTSGMRDSSLEIEDPTGKKIDHLISLAARTSRIRLLAGFSVDLLVCIFGSLLFTAAYVSLTNFDIVRLGMGGEFPEAIDAVVIVSLYICIFLASLLAYPLISLIFYDTTLGGRLAGLQILRIDGEVLDIPRIVVRSFVTPVSLLLFSFVFVAFGKRSLQDTLAGTVTFEEQALQPGAI